MQLSCDRDSKSDTENRDMWVGWAVLVIGSGVGAVLKETTHYDDDGKVIRTVTEDISDTAKCWQYTWMGPETEKTNNTGSCMDLETEDGIQKPCFSPIVWTVNDEYGENEPDLDELEEQCDEVGCNPFCTPGPSERCMKYTEWSKANGGNMIYTAKFCGTVTVWDGNHASGDRCVRSNGTEYCYCNKEMKINCNTGFHTSPMGTVVFIAMLILGCL